MTTKIYLSVEKVANGYVMEVAAFGSLNDIDYGSENKQPEFERHAAVATTPRNLQVAFYKEINKLFKPKAKPKEIKQSRSGTVTNIDARGTSATTSPKTAKAKQEAAEKS